MEEEKQDVTVDPSATTEVQEVVEQVADTSSQQQVVEQPPISTEPPAGNQQVVESDDMGVPYKNRYMESQRKLEKTQKQQEQILQKLDTIEQGSKQQEHTIAELETFVAETDNDAHRLWAQKEIRKKEQTAMADIVRTELDKRDQVQLVEQSKKQSLESVMQRYPDAFLKNSSGRSVGWDTSNPLTQRIGQYMQDPEIANNPRGLQVAAAMAFADLSLNRSTTVQKQAQKLKTEVKTLQKQTMVEAGGGHINPSVSSRQAAMEKTKSGKPKDAIDAMKELWKATGRLEG